MKSLHGILILTLLFSCCTRKSVQNDQLFTLLPVSETNVEFVNRLTESEDFNLIEYLYYNNGAGVAAGDINNDGLTDLYFTSNQESNKLFLNKGNFVFEDITESAGVAGNGNWKTGVTMADVNGDGFLDIYVCQVGNYKKFNGKNQLFINQGNMTFREQAKEYGLDFQGFSTQAAFFDYDLDGDLDMFLLNHSVHTSRSYGSVSLRFEQDSLAGDKLYLNEISEGKHYFSEVTHKAGIYASQIGYGLGVNISDINDDGFPDIYVSNDFHENDYLYINNGNGTFSEKLTEFIRHTSRSSMGNDIADFNNDGLLDILVLDMLPDNEKIRQQSGGEDDYGLSKIKQDFGYNPQFVRNTLQLNLGGNLFSEIGLLAGIYSTDWSWSPLFCDLDNDGWKDIFITSGIYRRGNDLDYVKYLTGGNRFFPEKDNSNVPDKILYDKMPLYPNVNYMFRNNRDLTFSNENNRWGSGPPSYSNGSAYADLDNDGDLDLIVNNINESAFIYRNNSSRQLSNHYLAIRLTGEGPNTRGTGSRIKVYSAGLSQVAEQFSTRGFMSSVSDIIHFGLGSSEEIDSLQIRWPDGKEQKIRNIRSDTIISLKWSDAAKPASISDPLNKGVGLFKNDRIKGLTFKHEEDKFTDLERERLIPHSLASEGPALAVGDINGDQLDDIFIGGAKGQVSKILVQQKDGTFRDLEVPLFISERESEDIDAAFFDADGDKDLDLYIVRGGNELPAGNILLSDILLINNGNGGFTRGKIPFISHNGSCVRPCDFDKDGDIDLFTGSRSLPGAYGWPPEQYLLENNGNGVFRDVTDQKLGSMKNAGMVTDAEWIDYDNDGNPDLVLSGEWMKITILKNENGIFRDVSGPSGLGNTSGWWYCITAADIDKDGDTDFIGGNLGLNSILKATREQPVVMYINDFDNNGALDEIICFNKDGKNYPVASLDELAGQINGFEKNFPKYSDFGGKAIEELFPKNIIESSTVRRAEMFETCLFLNKGDGTFNIYTLPVEAQFSTVRDILAGDFDGDGINDLIVAGNDSNVRPSYGRYDASYGWFIKGGPASLFKTIMPVESGLAINGDARKLSLIKIAGKQNIAAAVNNSCLQVFEIRK